MTQEKIRERLANCHEAENKLNKEMTRLNWVIKDSVNKKIGLAKKVSTNMKYRNSLIKQLTPTQSNGA